MQRLSIFRRTANERSEALKNKFFNVVLILSLLMFVTSAIQTSGKLKLINKEVTDREDKLTQLRKEEEEMQKKYDEVTSPEYMEKQLRNQLNMSKENEVILVLPEDEILKKFVPPDEEGMGIDTTPNYLKWAELFGIKI